MYSLINELHLSIAGGEMLRILKNFCLLKLCLSMFQFSSVAQSYPALCDPMNCCMPGLRVHHQLLETTQTHVH